MTSIDSLVLADTPIGYYRTASGALVPDVSGHGRDATLAGAVALIDGPFGHEKAFTNFSSDNTITLPAEVALDTSQSCTIEMFYRIASGAPNNSAFTIGNPGSFDIRCQAHMMYAGTLYFDFGLWGDAGRVSVTYPSGDYSDWTHVCLVADTDTDKLSIWLDGAKVAEAAWLPRTGSLSGGFIGSWPGGGMPATSGDIAEFAVYDHALSDARILAHSLATPLVGLSLTPDAIPSEALVGTPEITQRGGIAPSSIASGSAVGTPTLTSVFPPDRIAPRGLAGGATLGAPRMIGGLRPIRPAGIPSAATLGGVGVLSFGTRHILPRSIVRSPAIGIADVALSGPTTVYVPAIAPSGLVSAPVLFQSAGPGPGPPPPEPPIVRPRNRLINRTTGEVYPWPVNHATEDAIKTLGRQLTRGGMSASGFLIRQPTHPGPVHLALHGSMIDRDQQQYHRFVAFFNDCDGVVLDYIDATGDSYIVVLTQLDARRKMSAARLDASIFEYTLDVEVLAATSGALKGYAL